ncbi:DNA mismatch repair protein MutL [Stereum hirsutum FP-91666 SS1]|uniref:DNA mismatch repair protein MutL n=1 Tax=Stereum hirsutum (strain FP-91666) TaxID=721885 RepID=UPI000444985F|nr:DNA mismatch repair protein MutL [Stereum hirsutum FP-91666 SS1]EIM82138.1 DNA mismatch repair protein MutL [Stereum hirsutum FP-91666 SS1]
MSADNSSTPVDPKPIRRLEQSLVNRIAAGEIIHRPASALKELLENSLDAGTTSIRVTVKDGGLKLMQIQDNGCGIKKGDLPILAQRFTTSKLATFSDLSHLTTYGFRGEALASISHIANLTVTTKTKKDSCAWKACYIDGELVSAKDGQSPEPKPCAGNDGTTILVENLFYNTPTRLSALRSSSEEYARILDVVTKYAVHNPLVAFVCKKAGSPSPDLTTPSASTTPTAIRLLYGQAIGKELMYIHVTPPSEKKGKRKRPSKDEDDDIEKEEETERENAWEAEVHCTNVNYHAKQMIFILFINHRLVESSRIKRAIEAVYTSILPKGSSPFVYLSLLLDPTTVDVNVHPTKREVHFLNEETITEHVCDAIHNKLAAIGERTYEYQTLLTGGLVDSDKDKQSKGKSKVRSPEDQNVANAEVLNSDAEEDNNGPGAVQVSAPAPKMPRKKTSSQHKVRTSVADRTLDSMFPVLHPSTSQGNPVQSLAGHSSPTDVKATDPDVPSSSQRPGKERSKLIPESICNLLSVQELRRAVASRKHQQLSEILEKHTFVGVVDLEQELSLVQFSTQLYLVDHGALAEELFYQLGLRQFGDMPRLKLDPPAPLRLLLSTAVETEESTKGTQLTTSEIVDVIEETLMQRREMLLEYFSIVITDEGMIETLPMLLKDYSPNLDKLPLFLMRLGPQVDWTSEKGCFDTFLRELAYFYTPGPTLSPSDVAVDDEKLLKPKEVQAERWQIQHTLFPAMRRYLSAPKSLLARDVVQVADLPNLYKIFERC